jgi:hypothetical protein
MEISESSTDSARKRKFPAEDDGSVGTEQFPAEDDGSVGTNNHDEGNAEVCVYLDLEEMRRRIPDTGARDSDSVAEWFAGWRIDNHSQEAKRGMRSQEQEAFFHRVLENNFSVVGVNEFMYSKERTIEREYWIWDVGRNDEWVILHVHFAGKWCADAEERGKRMQIVTQVNLRHSVTADQSASSTWRFKSKDMDAWREQYGSKVEDLGYPWNWEKITSKNSIAEWAIKKIMERGGKCGKVRTIRPARASVSSVVPSLRSQSRRLALILSVSKYDHEEFLPNPIRDGESLKSALEEVQAGWEVTLIKNPSKDEARRKLHNFICDCEGLQDAVMVAFIGHGISGHGTNSYFLLKDSNIPVNCTIDSHEVEVECINTVEVQEMFKWTRHRSNYPPTILVFDCCRTHLQTAAPKQVPPPKGAQKSVAGAVGASDQPRGVPNSPEYKNLYLIYSTNSGNTAADGPTGGNGPFVSIFQRLIKQQPSISGRDVMDELYETMYKDHEQLSLPIGHLSRDFYFGKKPVPALQASASNVLAGSKKPRKDPPQKDSPQKESPQQEPHRKDALTKDSQPNSLVRLSSKHSSL